MRTFSLSTLSHSEKDALVKRPSSDTRACSAAAAKICSAVRSEGDEAVRRFTRDLDGVSLGPLRVPEEDAGRAHAALPRDLLEAIRTAKQNVTSFHAAQGFSAPSVETMPGVRCWREVRPLRRVGLYIPAGTAPLMSTLIMLGVPATLAGCDEIAVCSPPAKSGSVDPIVLATAYELGIREVYHIGGAQAIAAMAYGTRSIERVDKVFGPGNAYVTAAKQLVSIDPEGAAIDLPAGPSELLVLADDTARPAFVAADLLSQAEHDPLSQIVLVTTDPIFAERTLKLITERVGQAPRRDIIAACLRNSFVIIASSLEEAVDFSNLYAPEHVSVQVAVPNSIIPSIRNAGSVFVGPWSPVTAGDYASGTNHTLPTCRNAVAFSGISVESFSKTISFQSLTQEGLRTLSRCVQTLSRAEKLEEHTRAVEVRLS